MKRHRLDVLQTAAAPWKNGAGVARETTCLFRCLGRYGFDWRVSMGKIRQDGLFSFFTGLDRRVSLIDGAGVQLRRAQDLLRHHRVTPWTRFVLAGERLAAARLGKDFATAHAQRRCALFCAFGFDF